MLRRTVSTRKSENYRSEAVAQFAGIAAASFARRGDESLLKWAKSESRLNPIFSEEQP
jgi:hypothetical protein